MAAWLSVALLLLMITTAAAAEPLAPRYDRSMWLEDSAGMLDLVVEGKVVQRGDHLVIEISRILAGRFEGDSLRLAAVARCRLGENGIWMLIATPEGHVGLNPDDKPLAPDEWKQHEPAAKRTIGEFASAVVEQEEDLIARHIDEQRDGQPLRRSLVVRSVHGALTVERIIAQERTFHRSFDERGRLLAIHRTAPDGAGLSMAFDNGHLWSHAALRGALKHGLSREYYRHAPTQLREETHWRSGIRHGQARQWDEEGKLISDITYEDGLIAPIVRYRGSTPASPPATMHHTETGISYKELRPIALQFQEGMTLDQVSTLLQLDFSPASGIHFPFHTRRTYLHIEFADGKISRIRTGDNSVCFEPAGKR